MSKKNTYDDVAGMVRDASESLEPVAALKKRLSDRQVIKHLLILRAAYGMSQEDIARALNCSQSRISKLENGADADLGFADLVRYVNALGCHAQIVIFRKGTKLVDQVKFHFLQTREIMERLVRLSKTDPEIAKGVAKFFGEAGFNFLKMICDKAQKLPEDAQEEPPFVMIADECDAECGREGEQQLCHSDGKADGEAVRTN
jgi:transcriptional regulator with XRE-family HTH domain